MVSKQGRVTAEIQRKLEAHRLWRSSYFSRGERADLRDCDLSGADLHNFDLSGARLQGANLRGAYLVDTIFHGNNLGRTDLTGAVMFDSVFRRVDLSETYGLETIVHHGPSTIGIDTLLRSRGKVPLEFLVGAGIPIRAATSLLDWAARHGLREQCDSVFISYGGPDEPFARKLTSALVTHRVETFCFAVHAKPGMKLFELMNTKANDYDRVLLIASEASLERPGVLNELDEVLRREAREGGTSVLIPIAVDDYVYSRWNPSRPALSRAIRDRVIADFRGALGRESIFQTAFERLLGVLRRTE